MQNHGDDQSANKAGRRAPFLAFASSCSRDSIYIPYIPAAGIAYTIYRMYDIRILLSIIRTSEVELRHMHIRCVLHVERKRSLRFELALLLA